MNNELIINDHKSIYHLLKDLKSWDYIDTLNFSTQEIQNFYKSMILNVEKKDKDEYIESIPNMPEMVSTFYYFIYFYQKLPTQEQYIRFYYYIHSDWIKNKVGESHNEGLIGRLSRFYPSMLRDLHFYHLLKESKLFQKVLFVLKYDLEGKVDVFVSHNSLWYGLQLRTNTFRSNTYYKRKPNRNAIDVKAKLIDLPIDLKKAMSLSTKKDSIKLYSSKHIQLVLNSIHIAS